MGVLCNTHVHLRRVPSNSPHLLGALEPEAEASYSPVFRVVAQLQRRPEETVTSDKSLGSDQVDSDVAEENICQMIPCPYTGCVSPNIL